MAGVTGMERIHLAHLVDIRIVLSMVAAQLAHNKSVVSALRQLGQLGSKFGPLSRKLAA